MEHVVFFPAHDGSPAFRRVASLEDAVRLVEHLRNAEDVTDVSMHALAEVPLAFTTWYRVEVPTVAPEASPVGEPAVEALVAVDVPEQAVADLASASESVSANGHPAESNGPSSLGFFAS